MLERPILGNQSTLTLLGALKRSATVLSFNVFVVLSLSLIGLTTVSYMTFDYFLSHADFKSVGVILVFIGYITFVLEFAYIVWIFNHDSEHLCDQVKLLKNTLDEIYIEDHEFVFDKGQLRDSRFADLFNILSNSFYLDTFSKKNMYLDTFKILSEKSF